jgi:GTP-binding protein Era
MKSGFVAIIGRPNVGKSTFLNAIIGKKIAIMSNKPQTTRNTISGVFTTNDAQIIFIDTPGIHKPHNELGARMTKSAYQSTRGVDAILWMISAKEHFTLGEEMILDNIKNTNTPVFLCINKIDLLKNRNEIDKIILEYKDKFNFKGIYPISALENQNIVHVLNDIKEVLPEGKEFLEDTVCWLPLNEVELASDKELEQMERLLSLLEEDEDVQDVYHNVTGLPLGDE